MKSSVDKFMEEYAVGFRVFASFKFLELGICRVDCQLSEEFFERDVVRYGVGRIRRGMSGNTSARCIGSSVNRLS